jgi:hypothetical protein
MSGIKWLAAGLGLKLCPCDQNFKKMHFFEDSGRNKILHDSTSLINGLKLQNVPSFTFVDIAKSQSYKIIFIHKNV